MLERGDNLEKNGIDIEMRGGEGATFLLLYNSIAFTVCAEKKVKFPLLHFDSSIFEVSHARFSS